MGWYGGEHCRLTEIRFLVADWGFVCAEFACSPRVSRSSGFLPHFKDMQIRSTAYFKLPIGEKVSLKGCSLLRLATHPGCTPPVTDFSWDWLQLPHNPDRKAG